ncbi:hypothetical protein BAE44_0018772, partial [Dichanthelium oligosanthes]
MASNKRGLLLVIAVAVASVVASGAPPVQPPRIQADVVVTGFVPCNNGTSMRTGSAPGFAGALVQLQCTDGADLAANATTDGKGWFRMAVNTTVALSSVASHCDLVVDTPLVSCNATLPAAGMLHSNLRLLVSKVLASLAVAKPLRNRRAAGRSGAPDAWTMDGEVPGQSINNNLRMMGDDEGDQVEGEGEDDRDEQFGVGGSAAKPIDVGDDDAADPETESTDNKRSCSTTSEVWNNFEKIYKVIN